ncbi:MAG: glycosyltransferase family 4 protein [Chitinivibrionales bacterium]|nr:glycosyltransferase family 4 protein [Chitinivibrionales bacterium]
MKIDVYCYDDIDNPRCGGGGAMRELHVHRLIAAHHPVRFFTGNFPGAKNCDEPNLARRHLGFKNNYLLSRISFALLATLRSLWSPADIIAIPYSIYSPVLTFLFKPAKTIVLFFHVTGKEVFKKYNVFGMFPWLAETIALHAGRNYITLTDSLAQSLLTRRPGIKARAGYVSFDSSFLSQAQVDHKFILCFGRIDVRMKGLDVLIAAFEKIAGAHREHSLVIAGRGQESNLDWVRRRINESPFRSRIKFLVNVNDRERLELFHTSTFVCMPSRWEGWNIAAIEAAASSKATLGTRIQGLRDAIRENKTGLLVLPDDTDALAEKMGVLLDNAKLRGDLGRQGYLWAQNFTWEKTAGIQEEFYLEVFKTGGPSRRA